MRIQQYIIITVDPDHVMACSRSAEIYTDDNVHIYSKPVRVQELSSLALFFLPSTSFSGALSCECPSAPYWWPNQPPEFFLSSVETVWS